MSRKVAREVAMKLIFASLFGGEDTYEAVLEKSGIAETPDLEDVAFVKSVMTGVDAHVKQIDQTISELAIGWSLSRIPKVDLAILRIAIYEMTFCPDIPKSVSINEAVELAKRFGGEKSSGYINGVLGTLEKKLCGTQAAE